MLTKTITINERYLPNLTDAERMLLRRTELDLKKNPMDVVGFGKLLYLYWKAGDTDSLVLKGWQAGSLGLKLSGEVMFLMQKTSGRPITFYNSRLGFWMMKISTDKAGIHWVLKHLRSPSTYIATRNWGGGFAVLEVDMMGKQHQWFSYQSKGVLDGLRRFFYNNKQNMSPEDHIPSVFAQKLPYSVQIWGEQQAKPRNPGRPQQGYEHNPEAESGYTGDEEYDHHYKRSSQADRNTRELLKDFGVPND